MRTHGAHTVWWLSGHIRKRSSRALHYRPRWDRVCESVITSIKTNMPTSIRLVTARTEVGAGNNFTSVCQEFCPRGEGVGGSATNPPGQTPPGQTPPLPWADTPPPGRDHRPETPPPGQTHSPGAVHAVRYGQQAGVTHPTWMHSCFYRTTSIIFKLNIQWSKYLSQKGMFHCLRREFSRRVSRWGGGTSLQP